MGSSGKSKSKKQTVGYTYFMAAIFGLCIKATKLLKIVYGERVAWSGEAADGAIVAVDNPNLYGGEEVGGSGGLKGNFHFNCGGASQQPNPVMREYLGADCPAHRGVVTLSMDSSSVASFSPSFRPLYCLIQNLGYDWYPAKATIAGTQINPAHEIRDALINPDLSGQYDAAELDDDSFKAAADMLYAENFGLSPKWSDSGRAQEYIQDLLTHIDGVLVRDRTTGKIRLKLLRGGYDVNSLPVIGESQFSEVTSFGAVSPASMINKLTIKYARVTEVGEETATLTGENLANIAMQGGFVNATELEFKHLTDAVADLPGRILARELRMRSFPLRSFTLTGVHSLSSFQEGDLFVLNAPSIGINSMVCRVLEADYGTLDDHHVALTCTEDIYGVTATSISTPPVSEWQDVFAAPSVPTVCMLREMPLYLAVRLSPLNDLSLWTTDYPLAGFVLSLARKNAPIDRGYTHKILNGSTWEKVGDGSFSDSLLLTADASPVDTGFAVADTSLYALKSGDLAFIGNEIVRIDSWSAHTVTVTRGVLDTLPQAHTIGTRLWLPGAENGGVCTQQYTSGQKANIALVPFNATGEASPVSSDRIAVSLQARAYRPYPPGGLALNGTYLASEINDQLTVSWKHRDRLEQIDSVVSQTAADIGPEEGVTYNLKVYDEKNTLKKNLTGLTGTSWTWETETADCEFFDIDRVWFSTNTSNDAATSFSVTLGAAILEGDLLLAHVMHRDIVTPPDGWTLITETPAFESGQQLSVYRKDAAAADAGSTSTWAQASSVRINVLISAWRHESGVGVSLSGTVVTSSTPYTKVALPKITSTKNGLVIFAVSIVWLSSTNFSTSIGNFFTPSSGSQLRLAVGSSGIAEGQTFSGTVTENGSDRTNNMGTTAVVIFPKNNAPVRQYNRQVRVELESVRDGYTSLQRWNHTVTRPNEVIPDPEPTNLLLAAMTPGTATYGSLTVGIDADGIITLDGTVSGTALNVKYTGGLEINPSRPAAWDSDAAFSSGTGALTQTVSIAGGTFTAGQSDSINVTTRHSISTIFLNCKVGDGIMSAGGTPASPVRMGVIYLRGGTVLNNLKLAVSLTENGE